MDIGISDEEWNIFLRRWEVFRTGSGLDESSVQSQLFQCAGSELGGNILKNNPTAASGSLTQLLSCMCSLAVIPIATCEIRSELLQLLQSRDESFRTFTARVRGKAETCAFNTKCNCGKEVNFTDHVIKDVLLNGLYDPDIRREVSGAADILSKPINDVIALFENKEKARNALPSPSLSAVSSFQRQKSKTVTTAASPSQASSRADQNKEATCSDCATPYKIYTQEARG